MIDIRATATIVRGVTNNRVRMRRAPRTGRTLGPEHGRRRDGYRVITISVYRDDLAIIDTAATLLRVSRSEFLRRAARLMVRAR